MAIPVWVSIHSRKEATLVNAACIIIELNWLWQMDKSNVIVDEEWIVVLMLHDLLRMNLYSAILHIFSDIVSSKHDIHECGSISTVTSGHDPFIRDDSSTTEVFVINEQGSHPWVLVGCSLITSNDTFRGSWKSAISSKTLSSLFVSRIASSNRLFIL